jgi:hypothetical protein
MIFVNGGSKLQSSKHFRAATAITTGTAAEQGEQERQEESLERGESYSSNNTHFRGAKEN